MKAKKSADKKPTIEPKQLKKTVAIALTQDEHNELKRISGLNYMSTSKMIWLLLTDEKFRTKIFRTK